MLTHFCSIILFITDNRLYRHHNDGSNPIHKSHFNRKDPANIISTRVKLKNGSARTHYIYKNGTGIMYIYDKKEYSISAKQNI